MKIISFFNIYCKVTSENAGSKDKALHCVVVRCVAMHCVTVALCRAVVLCCTVMTWFSALYHVIELYYIVRTN